ncbi:serine/threonine-protein kinase [Actinomadura sp. DC4]|uniref:serine/threonine-protein kinase n=1 Tax=Actinomadura sp. DC4 TaxID=3055069 RepID=UPI0025B14CC1|nr:serine/threonine-protein kinase [Actinomadura sp. DC4]MDN3352955.1 serine/threonine-protein kinase [Actinomadura sp. DC4]
MTTPLVLSHRYRLDERLASGGMGEVWKATDELLGRPVAVKVLKEQYVSDESFRMRFRAEARFAASLQHSGIAQVYDYGEQDDLAFLVMELVVGETLSRILSVEGRLSVDTSLDIIGQAARALRVAHTAGIIHRDIKPANLMVTAEGVVKITDFGIARGGGSSTMTQTGQVMGTAQYVSPEQATGRRITPASDLYSLGVVAYECLAGMPPFAADTPIALAVMHVREDPPPLPADIPPPVRGLVSAMLAKDPDDRPTGAQEVADEIHMLRQPGGFDVPDEPETEAVPVGFAGTHLQDSVDEDEPTGAHPGPWAAAGRHRTSRFVIALAFAAVLVGTAVFAAGTLWKGSGHTKLVDGNRVEPAGRPAPTRQYSRGPDSTSPTDTPEPSTSLPTGPYPFPTPTYSSSTPTSSPSKTPKPPKRTPTPPATTPTPPTDPEPSSSAQGTLGSEGRA